MILLKSISTHQNFFLVKIKSSPVSISYKPMKKHWDIWFWNVLLFSTLPNGQPRGVIVRFWVYLNNIGQLTQNCLTVCASWLPGSPTGDLQVVGMSLVVGLLYIYEVWMSFWLKLTGVGHVRARNRGLAESGLLPLATHPLEQGCPFFVMFYSFCVETVYLYFALDLSSIIKKNHFFYFPSF